LPSDGPCRNTSPTPQASRAFLTEEQKRVTRNEAHKLRQKRYREVTDRLKEEARERGLSPRRNASISELEELLRVTPPRDADVTLPSRERHLRVGVRAEFPNTNTNTNSQKREPRASDAAPRDADRVTLTAAGTAALAMKRAGMSAVNPSHPELAALLDAGVTAEELADIAAECVERGKGFAYALAVARGRRQDAAQAAVAPAQDKDAALMRWAGPTLADAIRRKGGML
jgi:hypothetical protein